MKAAISIWPHAPLRREREGLIPLFSLAESLRRPPIIGGRRVRELSSAPPPEA